MIEGLTKEVIALLMEENKLSLEKAFETLYLSETYKNLKNPATGLYFQSAGYVFSYLQEEMKAVNSVSK